MADTGYLPNLLGPVVIEAGGVAQTPRPTINFVGCTGADNPTYDRVDITPSADVGLGTALQVLRTNAAGTATEWASPVTVPLTVANGGTGQTALTHAVSALDIDWSAAPTFTKTLAAGANTITFSNMTAGQVIVVRLIGAASTVTWPTVLWPGGTVPTQTSAGKDVYTFFYDGTDVYGQVGQAFA